MLDQYLDASAESHMAPYVEWIKGKKVAFRTEYNGLKEITCIDSGTNRFILIDNANWDSYRKVKMSVLEQQRKEAR